MVKRRNRCRRRLALIEHHGDSGRGGWRGVLCVESRYDSSSSLCSHFILKFGDQQRNNKKSTRKWSKTHTMRGSRAWCGSTFLRRHHVVVRSVSSGKVSVYNNQVQITPCVRPSCWMIHRRVYRRDSQMIVEAINPTRRSPP